MATTLATPTLLLLLALSASAQTSSVQEGRLLEPVPESASNVGAQVAISAGRIAVSDPDPGRNGQVFTYTTSAGLWQFDAGAIALDGAPADRFGYSLALEGDTMVVGAFGADIGGVTDSGAAYVFARSGASWVQQQKFTPPVPKFQGQFGAAVVISGNTLAIGAPQTDSWSRGEVHIFVRSGGVWSFQQMLVPSGLEVGAHAGYALALEGDRLVVGAPYQSFPGLTQVGLAFVFERSGSVWSEVATLSSPNPIPTGSFGSSLALDGGRIAVGAIGEPITNAVHGRVHLFTGAGSSWNLEQTLSGVGTSTQNCAFGTSLSLEGTRMAVGAPNYNTPLANYAGAVKVFERSGSTWTERLDLYGATSSFNDQLGTSAALAGSLVVGGAPNGDVSSQNTRGEAYVFRLDPATPASYCTAKTTAAGCVPAIGWSGTPSASSAAPFVLTASQLTNNKPGLLIYGNLYNQLPFQGGTLCVAAPIKRTPVQSSGGSATGSNCSGHFSFDFNAWIQGGHDASLVVGKWVFAQYWFRDPLSPSATGLTDALRFRIE